MTFYFAYGSNMDPDQMAERIPRARSRGRARLPEHRFTCNKVGRDGTAKANVAPEPGSEVWGVLYGLEPADLEALDRYEGGYRREVVAVELDEGRRIASHVYVSDRTSETLLATEAYRARMVRGAREHRLPEAWIRLLEGLAVAQDRA